MDKEAENQSIHKQMEKDKADEKIKIGNTKVYLHCRGHAAIALNKLHGGGLDPSSLMDCLSQSVDRITNGNTNEIEAMLITQAKSLEYMFYDALTKLPNASMEHTEVFANIALRAQTGCRKTLMALTELKHPRRTTTFIKQQNNALTQQVNNCVKSESHPIENNKKDPNELNAEGSYEPKKMDIGTTIRTSTTNTRAEAMVVLDRPKNS